MAVVTKTVEEIRAELEEIRAAKQETRSEKKDWYGLVYCDSNGWASIVGNKLEAVWLGKSAELIPYFKGRHIDGENIDEVLIASAEFRSERKSQSYHLAMRNDAILVITPPSKSNRIIFKKDPHFLRLLEHLISKGYGVPTIQTKLKAKGYSVPYATLGRWIKERGRC